jgi:L-ascorbate metabolism protein UlaG (beta-lactamase superfamily)
MMSLLLRLLVVNTILFSSSCVSYQPQNYDHYQNIKTYKNTSGDNGPDLLQVILWRLKRIWYENDYTINYSVIQPDVDFLHNNDTEPTVTWLGHSTLLLQLGKMNILTDPNLSDTASPVSWAGPERVVPPALSLEQLPSIDYIFISHNHYDHLDKTSIKYISEHLGRKSKKPHFFVPLGLKDWFTEQGVENVTEMDWWETVNHGDWIINATPVHHHSGRGLFDKNKTLWTGWSIQYKKFKFFFAGDTAYSRDFKDIGEKLGPFDLAAIPIGGYSPRELMKSAHASPEEALQIHLDIGAKRSIGIHWGTFSGLTDEPLDEPPKRLKQALINKAMPLEVFEILKHGETRSLLF